MLRLQAFAGNPNVGVFVRATQSHAFVPLSLTALERRHVEEALQVPLVATSIGGTTLLGSLLAANRRAVAVSDIATKAELEALRKTGLRVVVVQDRLNAVGNNVLVNDRGGVCDPDYTDQQVRRLTEAFGVPVERATVAGLGTVGMAGVATDRGVLVHPKSTPQERETLRRVLGVDVMVGTINHGTGLIGAGLVANSNGALIGSASTTIEIARIEDALGFLPAPVT